VRWRRDAGERKEREQIGEKVENKMRKNVDNDRWVLLLL